MYKEILMQRTQIYFEQDTLLELKGIAKDLNISVSEFIRGVMKTEIKKQKKSNLNSFLTTMEPLESFSDVEATEYVQEFRGKSRLLND